MSEWISVEDELPPNKFDEHNRPIRYIVHIVDDPHEFVGDDTWTKTWMGWHWNMFREHIRGTVTHWMDYPVLPGREV